MNGIRVGRLDPSGFLSTRDAEERLAQAHGRPRQEGAPRGGEPGLRKAIGCGRGTAGYFTLIPNYNSIYIKDLLQNCEQRHMGQSASSAALYCDENQRKRHHA